MRRKHTTARKARTLNLWGCYQSSMYSTPVFLRRAIMGAYGADHADFDRKHPDIELAAAGLRSRLEQQKRDQQRKILPA